MIAVLTMDDLTKWVDAGFKVFPCHSIRDGLCSCGDPACDNQGKHPRTHNGVYAATDNLAQIAQWVATYQDANWAVATGQASGFIVIDPDAKKDGLAEWDRFAAEAVGHLPDTFSVRTGGGGRHLYFKTDQTFTNKVNWLSGVDVRADRGYVLLPGSNHISGGIYEVENPVPIARLPEWLADLLGSSRSADSITDLATDDILAGVPEGQRDHIIFRAACRWRRQLGDNRVAVTTLVLEAARNAVPPFPEKDALRKVEQAFAQDHTDEHIFDFDAVPFLEDADPKFIEDVAKGVHRAKVSEAVKRVLREERVAKYGDAAALDGDAFLFGEDVNDAPIWGAGDDLLWTEGGGLMIASDQGLGKSLTAQQLVAGRLGVGPSHLLDLPIQPLPQSKTIVYLALDRPRQIRRSMRRLFRTERERAVARERLRVWTKPIPVDVLGDTYAMANWIQETFGENVADLVVDSVKDLTPGGLSKDEVGQALDMAWKECRARGMSTLLLHHERKAGTDTSRANRQPLLDHIYGSTWLTSGMDSVLHIQGKQGENVVTYTHLKAILNLLDPITAMHDQENGRTAVMQMAKAATAHELAIEQVFAVIENLSAGGGVATAGDVSARLAGLVSAASVNRHIKKLVESGRIVQVSEYDKATATPATYRVSAEGHHWEP